MRLIGVDPGQTTGYVKLLHDHDGELRVLEAKEIVWTARMELIPLIAASVLEDPQVPTTVVVESFRLFPHEFHHQVGSTFPSVHIIGIIDAACWLANPSPEIIYQPAVNKSRVLIYHPLPGSEHVRDAYRHARYYYEAKRLRGELDSN